MTTGIASSERAPNNQLHTENWGGHYTSNVAMLSLALCISPVATESAGKKQEETI